MIIHIEPHTLERAEERGTNEAEIIEVVEEGFPIPAKYEKKGKAKVFEFKNERNGKYYEEKRVEVYYLLENETAITITVYVFYGKW